MSVAEAETRDEVRLELEGMSCAGCAVRIERTLNELEGVEATVNFATEQATVHCTPSVSVDELVQAVESAGYIARPAAAAGETPPERPAARAVTPQLALAFALTVPIVVLAMVPAARFGGWV